MTIDLAAVKAYCRIDWDSEDNLLTLLVEVAKVYLDGAGVPEPEADDPMYALAVKAMVLELYDHRGMTERVSVSVIPGMSNIIVMLKLRAEAERIAGFASGSAPEVLAMTMDLAAVKAYCRIDWDSEDTLLTLLVDAAKAYLDGAGIPEPEAYNPMYALAVKAIVLELYDHRGQTGIVQLVDIPGMASILVQLKLQAEDVWVFAPGSDPDEPMTIDLAIVKAYCRIDGDSEDMLLAFLVEAAKVYLEDAGVQEPEVYDPLYVLAVLAIVLELHDHRGQTKGVALYDIPGMANLIVQLKLRDEARRIVPAASISDKTAKLGIAVLGVMVLGAEV